MSMSDIRTEIQFGCTAAVSRDEIKQSKVDPIKIKRERMGAELGVKIAQAKEWHMRPEGELAISELSLYVFTPNELHDFLEARMKEKLISMALRETTTPELKEQLLTLSERI